MVSGTSASLCWTLLSVCFSVSASEGLINIPSEPKHTVILPCQAPRNTTVQAVEWIRRDLDNATVCFYRGSKCENNHALFKGRVQLNHDWVKNGDVSLILKNVMINDTGEYKCYVKQGESKRRKRDVNLDDGEMIKPIVYLKVGNSAEPGDTVILPCQAPRNTTVQAVEWIRRDLDNPTVCFYRGSKCENNHPLFKDRVKMNNDWVKNGHVSLILKNVMINDTGAYECRVEQGESKRRKRDVNLDDGEMINIVHLKVGNSGGGAGDTEDGGNKDGGDENGGNNHGLGIGLGVTVLFVIIGVVVGVFALNRKGFIKVKSDEQPAS